MFHLQKSSKSSVDNNRQINLLQEEDRVSRINFHRQGQLHNLHSPLVPKLRPRKASLDVHKEYQHRPHSVHSENGNAGADYNESPYCDEELGIIRGSVSMLTDSSAHSHFIGYILFAILLIFTPLEIFTLIYAASPAFMGLGFETTLELLLTSQLIAFAILYYLKWIDRVNIYQDLYRAYHRRKDSHGHGHPLNNPYTLSLLIVLATLIFELSYVQSILKDPTPSLLVLFISILPQISTSLLLEHQQQLSFTRCFYSLFLLSNAWLLGVCLALMGIYTLLACLSLMVLIYLSMRMGRECMYIEYMIGKFLMLLVVIGRDMLTVSEEEHVDWLHFLLVMCALVLSIVMVRCVINKILRNELYKYFYNDYHINSALFLLPVLIAWANGQMQWAMAVGCGAMLLICYKVGREKTLVNMGY